MTIYSIIKKSELEGASRIDAEYYQPEYFIFTDLLKKFGTKNLSELSIIRSGTTPTDRDDERKKGIILLKTTDIRNNILQNGKDYYFISEKIDDRMKNTRIYKTDVLINIVGATLDVIGRVAFIPTNFPKANITQAMALIRLKDKNFFQEFIFAFLMSKYGRFQIDKMARPTGQYNLNLEELGLFKIPLILISDQEKIKILIQKSQDFSLSSEIFYSEAENLLLGELELKDFESEIEKKLWSVVNLSEVKNVGRIDAEYFQPKYQKMFSAIKKYDVKTLGELVTIKKGFEPGSESYQDEGKLFIRVSSISKDGITDKDQKYLKDDLYQKLKKDFEPKIGEILLTKDASPGIAYVVKEQMEGLISGGVLKIKIKEDIEPEYVALVINSLVGQMQVERDAGGSIIAHWKPDQIKEMQIPILPKKTQQKIAELVRKSHEARRKAKELLEEAKRKVEELIEDKSVKDDPLEQGHFKSHL